MCDVSYREGLLCAVALFLGLIAANATHQMHWSRTKFLEKGW
jgi:hypothetical protein